MKPPLLDTQEHLIEAADQLERAYNALTLSGKADGANWLMFASRKQVQTALKEAETAHAYVSELLQSQGVSE